MRFVPLPHVSWPGAWRPSSRVLAGSALGLALVAVWLAARHDGPNPTGGEPSLLPLAGTLFGALAAGLLALLIRPWQRDIEAALHRSEARLGTLMEQAPDAILLLDADTARVIAVNSATERLLRRPADRLVGIVPAEMAPPTQPDGRTSVAATAEIIAAIRQSDEPATIEWVIQRDDGSMVTCEVRLARVTLPGAEALWVTISDVSQRRADQARMEHLAYYDSVTSLPNRVLFLDRLEQALADARRTRREVAVHFLDLDHFKNVNDTRGHAAGDEVLRMVAERLQRTVRETDTVARFGGDEYAVVQTGVRRASDAAVLARKVLRAGQRPYLVGGDELRCGFSVGVALSADHGKTSAETLLSQADMALYEVKERGRNRYAFHTPEMSAQIEDRVRLIEELERDLSTERFSLGWRAQHALGDGCLVGLSGQPLWAHATRGQLTAAEFGAAADAHGLRLELAERTLSLAIEQAKRWHAEGHTPPRIGVRVSGSVVEDAALMDELLRRVSVSGLPPHTLELELVEGTLASSTETIRERLVAQAESGLACSLAEFGSGYSSLLALKKMPFRQLQISAEFIRDLFSDADDAEIVRAMILLGKSLGREVVADGVTSVAQAEWLRTHGCEIVQGDLYGPLSMGAEISAILGNSAGQP